MRKQTYNNIAIIVAGGISRRVYGEIPKQYLPINNSTPLRICAEKFLKHKDVDAVIVVINKDHKSLYEKSVEGLDILGYVYGGKERQDSVRNALEEIKKYSPRNVLVHDASRIFFEGKHISALLKNLNTYKGSIVAVPVNDTVKYCEGDKINKTISRENMFLAQTPQVFDYKTISSLHQKYKDEFFSDDASLCEDAGVDIAVVKSSILNFKITTSQDFELAKIVIGSEYEKQS